MEFCDKKKKLKVDHKKLRKLSKRRKKKKLMKFV